MAQIAERYSINIHHALILPWSKDSWKQHCKTAVKSYWQRKLIQEAFTMSTLKHIIWSPDCLGTPHGIWKACTTFPHLVPAAIRRIKSMVGRLGLNYASWKKVDTTCPLCFTEEETSLHFLIRCPNLQPYRATKIKELQQIYSNDDKEPPRSNEELLSVVINGDCYISSRSATTTVIKLTNHCVEAQNLCSALCQRLYKERDHIINEKLMERI